MAEPVENQQRALAGILLAAVLLVAVWETATGLWQRHSVASQADWQAAAAAVRAEFRPGDLVAIAPAWADPLGRAELGDLMPIAMVGRPDGRRYPRIWELSIRGAHVQDVAGLQPEWSRSFGRVLLLRYSQRAVEVTFDLVEQFFSARIDSNRVERRTLEIDYRPRYGISVGIEASRPTQLTYADIPDAAWKGAELALWFGLHDYYERKNARGPAEVVVDLDDGAGRGALRVELERGLQPLVLALPQNTGRSVHTIRIEVSADSPPHHFVGILGALRR
jgi:hypothetical protein